jgi:membrane associated rhomboid family serine protease
VVCAGSFAAAGIVRDRRERAGSAPLGYEWALAPLLCAKVAVAAAWKLARGGRLEGTLQKHFLHTPLSGRALPLLLSSFSHRTLPHLGFSMFCLCGFAGVLGPAMGAEDFLAAYVSAGAVASLGSHAAFAARRALAPLALPMPPSLGASGALLACVAATAAAYPDLQFSVWFLPLLAVPAQTLLAGAVALDAAGLALGYTMIDHAAHMAGAALGTVRYAGMLCSNRGVCVGMLGCWDAPVHTVHMHLNTRPCVSTDHHHGDHDLACCSLLPARRLELCQVRGHSRGPHLPRLGCERRRLLP